MAATASAHAAAEFHYKARFTASAFVPGAHASRVTGGGLEVAAVVPLLRSRDPRRLDWRASLRDPFEGWWVREFHQRSTIPVCLAVDLSASMAAHGGLREAAAQFAAALQRSAMRVGDAFGVFAFAEQPAESLSLRPTRARQAGAAVVRALADQPFAGRGAGGLAALPAWLPREASLVFVVSDFCFPVPLLDAALAPMARHDVVPVWLRAPAAERAPSALGLAELRDAESGRLRTLWLRRSLRERWEAQLVAHEREMDDCLARHQRVALKLPPVFDPDAVSDYFAARG